MANGGRGNDMLTLTIKKEDKSVDIMVNEEQKIRNTISVLIESDMFKMEQCDYVVQSARMGKKIDPSCSYRDSHIYNGDVLSIEYTNQ